MRPSGRSGAEAASLRSVAVVMAVPLITESARYVLGLAVAVCVLALCVAIGLAFAGRREGSAVAASRGSTGILVGLLVLAVVLLLILIYMV